MGQKQRIRIGSKISDSLVIKFSTEIVIMLWDRNSFLFSFFVFLYASKFFYRIMYSLPNSFKPIAFIIMSWNINHFHLCLI